MSKQMRRNLAGGAGLVLLVLGASLLSLSSPFRGQAGPVREIVLEAKDVAFGGDNPTIHAKPGERIRFVIRNTDEGVLHSIAIPGIAPEVRHVGWGEQIVFEVTVPDEGRFEYVCPQHQPKMKGLLVVDPT